ncbi:MAG: glycosyltransferase family 2 protein [Candidatus Liptonbacteria bacterium]|nr:glycosyltransferase family 2 protein [Candidatus Liptonbacteria bacterium]
MPPFLSVIIPAYNEETRIPATLVAIDRYLRSAGFTYEIIVVNDGSTDGTSKVVLGMAETIPHLSLIDNAANKGKGGVVRQGFLAAHGVVRLFTDADNSTSVDQFQAMLPYFTGEEKARCDVVIGSRAARGAKLDPPQPLFRRVAGKALNLFTQVVLLPGIWDTQCGFKAFTERAAREIFSKTCVNGWAFDVEALGLAKALGFRIKEVPVVWKNNAFSRVPFSAGLHFLAENITIRFMLWMDVYGIRAGSKERTSN